MSRLHRGFTLLEVLVAIAILGLSLTAILSAQTGLFASLTFTEHISIATGLVRCKMSELELKMGREGFPLLDVQDEGTCCGDETPKAYKCKWKIDKVILPPPPTSSQLSSSLSTSLSGLGPLGAIATMGQSSGSALGSSAGLGDISKFLSTGAPAGSLGSLGSLGSSFGGLGGSTGGLGGSTGGAPSFLSPPGSTGGESTTPGTTGSAAPLGSISPPLGAGGTPGFSGAAALAPLVMGFVYPTLKPMLEASIRKVTVGVHWKEGSKDRDLTIQQFVTSPRQGGLDPNAAQGLDQVSQGIGGLLGGGALGGAVAPGAGTGVK